MKMQHFKTFMALAETKSFVATAKKLHMTQPGVSQHLRRLEEDYGVLLASRKGKHFQLTEAGKKLLSYCQKLFADHERLRSEIAVDGPTSGICSLASPGSFGIMLYSFLLKFNKKYPDLRFHFTVAPNSSIIQGVIDERYQLGFISIESAETGLVKKKTSQEKLLLVAPKKAQIDHYEDLKNIGFIAHPDGYHHATRLFMENFPRQFNSIDEIPFKGFVNQINRILDPVAEGLGFTVLPEYAVKSYPRHKEIQIVRLPKSVIDPIFAVSKQNSNLPKRYALMLSELQSHLKSLKVQL
jgi:DNA-binding transcriptional LysR family regulator